MPFSSLHTEVESFTSGQPPDFFVFLADLIQLYALNDNPSMLMLTSSQGVRATIALADRRIIHAQINETQGVSALHLIMRWNKGELSRRSVRRSPIVTIDDDLSTSLMNAYDHVMTHGTLGDDDLDSDLQLTSLEERSSPLFKREVSQITDCIAPSRLLWGESLRGEIKAMDGFVSFHLFDIAEGPHKRATQTVADHMINSLRESGVLEEDLELYLTLKASYHAFLRLPLGDHILCAVFQLSETTPAMVQYRLKKIIEDLPVPTSSQTP